MKTIVTSFWILKYFLLLMCLLLCINIQAQINVVKAEYFIDIDPGFNAAANIPLTASTNIANKSVTVPLNNVPDGFHNLFLRSRDANGNWSVTNKLSFFKTNTSSASLPNIVKAEYFIDTDLGFNAAVNIPITASANIADKSVTIPLNNVPDGFHNLFVRSIDANGKWSISNKLFFFKTNSSSAALPNIVKAEYFIDADPGFNTAVNIPVTASSNIADKSITIPLNNVPDGFHNLFVRSIDANGKWSISNKLSFFKTNSSSSVLPNIVKAEYFIDADPGFGNGSNMAVTNAADISDKSVSIPLANVSEGFHNLFIRTRDANGRWSISNKQAFFKTKSDAGSLPNIVRAEFFIDTDPGFGKANTIAAGPAVNISDLVFNVPLAGISAGSHRFYLRSQNASGVWSITNTDTFFLSSVVIPEATIGTINTPLCAGDVLKIPYEVNTNFTAGNIFTAQLSDASGNFTNPVNIGNISAIGSDTIPATIPANASAGNGYRIRIVSTSPLATSKPNASPITISRKPEDAFNISGIAASCFGIQLYEVSAMQAGTAIDWKISGGGVLSISNNKATVNWNTPGNYTLTAKASNSCGDGFEKTINISVFAAAPTITPGINQSSRTFTASGLVAGVAAWQWFKDGIIIAGQTSQQYNVPDNETGSYTVAYTNACGTGPQSAPLAINVERSNQTITFTPVPAKTFGDAAFNVSATASSGLPITTYSILSGPATISDNTVTITGAGTINVKAFQQGNNAFNEAIAFIDIIVNKAAASIVLGALTHTYDGQPKKAIAITNPLGLNTSITYNSNFEAPANAGSYATIANITSPNYSGTATGTVVISKATQTITLVPIGEKSFNDAAFTVFAASTSGLPVALTISTSPATGVAGINGNIVTLLGGGGTVTVFANQPGNNNYSAATQATTSFSVKPPLATDVQLVSLVKPLNGCGIGNQSDVIVKIKNAGTAAASNIKVSYKIDNGATITESLAGSLASGAELDYTFTVKGSFASAGKTYSVLTYTTLAGDQKLNNDTLVSAVSRQAFVPAGVTADTTICSGTEALLTAFGGGAYNWSDGPATASRIVKPVTTTSYEVSVTDPGGCNTSKYRVKVTVNPTPVASAGNPQTILRGSSVALTATGGGTYNWSTGDTSAQIFVSPQATTNYTVTVKNQFGCTATSEVKVTVNFSAINVVPAANNFGSIVIDSTAFKTIVISNTGTLTETINSLTNTDLSQPFFTALTTPVTLPAGASINIPVTFTPAAPVFYQNKFILATSAGNFTISLQGKGVIAAPAWTVTPSIFNYGNVEKDKTSGREFILKNTGNISINTGLVATSNPRFSGIIAGDKIIPVGGSTKLVVNYTPVSVATSNGSITVRTTTPDLSSLKLILTGTGFIKGAAPQLVLLSKAPYNGVNGVNPVVGQPGLFTYSVIYKHPDGVAPMINNPMVGIDKNADEDFVDDGEAVITLTKESNGTNWKDGEVFSFTTSLPVSNNYGYRFFARDALGNYAIADLNKYKAGPIVTREVLDLHIFASDIVFSKVNPAVNEKFQVTATIHNNSPYPAADIPVSVYYKDSIFLFNDTIPFIDGVSNASITKELSFAPDGFYPVKFWIDSAQTLQEGNILNNYASRPVIVGKFTVPGTIDVVTNATPSGCRKGKVTFTGKASYRGLNLAGKPPVEGATVKITVTDFGNRTIFTNTDINGEWYVYDDPCTGDADPECKGYECGKTYHYTVEVTDYTLTSPEVPGSFNRACVPCDPEGVIQHSIIANFCNVTGDSINTSSSIANFSLDFFGNKLCAPTVYKDTITVFDGGSLIATYTRDSISSCNAVSYATRFAPKTVGEYEASMTHVYYNAANERQEKTFTTTYQVYPRLPDLTLRGIEKTGHKAFIFNDLNLACGVPAAQHKIYLYDSMAGFAEKILLDSFVVTKLAGFESITLEYSNPQWQQGLHYLTLITDVTQIIPEIKEDNNVLKATFYVIGPDITIKDIITSNTNLSGGSVMNFIATLKNQGDDVTSPFKVQFFADGISIGSRQNVLSINNNEEVAVISPLHTVSFNPCPFQITAFADVDKEITEENELNNTDTLNVGVNIKAGRSCDDDDNLGSGFYNPFDPASQCIPYSAPKGVLTYLATTVKNTGNRDASNIKVRFSWMGNEIGSDVIPSLKAGEQTESGFFYAFDTVGNFIISAYADYTKEICELDEKDNIGRIHVGIKPSVADLEVLSQYIAPSNLNPNPGQSILIVASVVNKGDAPSVPTTVRFWVNDVPLGKDIAIDSLYPGMDTTVLATVSYSSDIIGPKIIKFTADVNNLVPERIKGNNEATRAIIVGDAPDFANSISEAITISPAVFSIGDSVTISNYLRNYGGATGSAWLKFFIRTTAGELKVLDSIPFTLASNDSARVAYKWKVTESAGMIITEILHAAPPEFNELNNIDSLRIEAVLPLTLISFNGKQFEKDAQLQWKTASEINTSHFEMERSANGRNFNTVGIVKAYNSAAGNYNYTDAGAFSKEQLWYYRLKMVDKNGLYRTSNIILLQSNKAPFAEVYPNPVQNILNVKLHNTKAGIYTINILDAAARQCAERKYELSSGYHLLNIPVTMLANGVYTVKISGTNGETLFVSKLVKEY
jgi:hypothetical protein